MSARDSSSHHPFLGSCHLRAGVKAKNQHWDGAALQAEGSSGCSSVGRGVGWEQGKSCDLLKPIVPTTANGTLYCIILYVMTV